MTSIKRRHFLQLAGSTLAALGLEQSGFFKQSEQYGKVLAQPTGRKVALLVGVNKYPRHISSLRGCLTDVEMQKQLLIHRYGFNPKDILVVSDEAKIKPTRANILRAFEEHLIGQVKPGDVALFHYSGHGSQVVDSRPIPLPNLPDNQLNGTLLAYNSRPRAGAKVVDDIMGKTLFLLSQAVNTENFTMVLDSCHSGGGTRGNLVFRSAGETRLGITAAQPSQTELAYQAQWMSKLGLTEDKLFELRKAGIAKGMALGSAQANQLAADAVFNGFYAGAFSYLLTQYLWQLPGSEPLDKSFSKLALVTNDVAGYNPQVPIYDVQKASDKLQPLYFIEPVAPAAEAVIEKAAGGQVQYWLGGVASRSLESYGQGSVFELMDAQGNAVGTVEQTLRKGLVAQGSFKAAKGKVQPGMLLREKIRGIPSDLRLKVGLDASLGQDLRGQLQQELSQLQRITPVVVDAIAPTRPVDFLISRLTPAVALQGQSWNVNIQQPANTVGLLSTGLTPIPDSFGFSEQEPAEAIASRLSARLKMLLAGKILASVVNSDSSELDVEVAIRTVGSRNMIDAQRSRGGGDGFVPKTLTVSNNQVKNNSEIEVVVTNNEARNLHVGVLAVFNTGELAVLHPTQFDSPEIAGVVAPGQSMAIPEKTGNYEKDFRFEISGGAGFFELLVLASTEPLRDGLKALKQVALTRGGAGGVGAGANPLLFAEGTRGSGESEDAPVAFMEAVLGDLSSTRGGPRLNAVRGRGVPASGLAGFSSVIEVVD